MKKYLDTCCRTLKVDINHNGLSTGVAYYGPFLAADAAEAIAGGGADMNFSESKPGK